MIHYGEEDSNKIKKPLGLETLNENDFKEYSVIKYFYSNKDPENFFNLIDKNDWTTERFDELYHNCIHCTNEYLILNNVRHISFGLGSDIAYEKLCDKCLKDLGRYKMYVSVSFEEIIKNLKRKYIGFPLLPEDILSKNKFQENVV